jgi:hypothetical protein
LLQNFSINAIIPGKLLLLQKNAQEQIFQNIFFAHFENTRQEKFVLLICDVMPSEKPVDLI